MGRIMPQAGIDRLDATIALGTSGTIDDGGNPFLMGSNLLVDIQVLIVNGATPPTVEASVTIEYQFESGGKWYEYTIIGSNLANEPASSPFFSLPATVYGYRYQYVGGSDQAVDIAISEGRFSA